MQRWTTSSAVKLIEEGFQSHPNAIFTGGDGFHASPKQSILLACCSWREVFQHQEAEGTDMMTERRGGGVFLTLQCQSNLGWGVSKLGLTRPLKGGPNGG